MIDPDFGFAFLVCLVILGMLAHFICTRPSVQNWIWKQTKIQEAERKRRISSHYQPRNRIENGRNHS
jgi:hypothetical protein